MSFDYVHISGEKIHSFSLNVPDNHLLKRDIRGHLQDDKMNLSIYHTNNETEVTVLSCNCYILFQLF